MVTCELKLEPTSEPQHAVEAWLIRGDGPAAWLATLIAFRVPLEAVRLLPLPRGPADVRPVAVVAVGLPDPATPIPQAQAYGCVGGVLYVPIHSRLQPALQPEELRAVVEWDYAVLHPTLGLFGYQADDVLTVAGLLAAPAATVHRWQAAQPGIIMNHRLTGVSPVAPPQASEIIGEGRDDIGTEGTSDLPAAPGEQAPGALGRMGQGMQRAVSGSIDKIRGMMPASGKKNWLDSLEAWSESTFGKLGGSDGDATMSKEAKRLLDMLERDPDQGLKHAMPCAGGAHRGMSQGPNPGLEARNVEFDISRLGGARPMSPWGLPWDLYQQLQKRYRELARRELGLGRHRRAAYIYAELLGDYSAAANVLQQGGHFREAAVLYRDYLRQPLRAARCLEEGGLLLEAIALYEAEGHDETIGDLYERLERRADAEAAWRRAVARYQETGDTLNAARLLEHKIQAPDEALSALAAAWPYRSQAGECLQAQFDLLGRLGRHHHSADILAGLRRDLPPRTPVVLVECLAQVTSSYPESTIRQDAADLARVVVGQRLPDSDYEESRMLLNALQSTEPGDRLLARDVGRFRDQKRRERVSMRKPWAPNRQNPHLLARHQLPVPRVLAATARREGFFVAGLSESGELVLVRCSWQGLWQRTFWRPDDLPRPTSLILDAGHYETQPVIMADRGRPALAEQTFPIADGFAHSVVAGSPKWLTADMLRVTQGHHHIIWVLSHQEANQSTQLDAYSTDGNLVSSRPIELSDPSLSARYLMSLAAVRNSVYLAIGPQLYEVGDDVRLLLEEPDRPILRLATSAPYTRQRLVASYAHGGAVIWPQRLGTRYESVASGMTNPLFTFTRGGALVAISGVHGEIYDTNQTSAVRKLDFTLPGEAAVAVTPGVGTAEFAVFDRQGGVSVYRLDAD